MKTLLILLACAAANTDELRTGLENIRGAARRQQATLAQVRQHHADAVQEVVKLEIDVVKMKDWGLGEWTRAEEQNKQRQIAEQERDRYRSGYSTVKFPFVAIAAACAWLLLMRLKLPPVYGVNLWLPVVLAFGAAIAFNKLFDRIFLP